MFKHESFRNTGFTLGSSSAKTRFALLPEGMPFRIMLAPDKSMRRKSCRWFPGARSAKGVPTASDAGMLFRRAVLGSPRLQGSHVLLRRTRREQALERTRQSFGGEFLRVRQPMPIRRLGGLGEIELRQAGK
jgi:hypothetical protein